MYGLDVSNGPDPNNDTTFIKKKTENECLIKC